MVSRFGADPVLGGPALIAKAWREGGDTSASRLSCEAFRRGCVLGGTSGWRSCSNVC